MLLVLIFLFFTIVIATCRIKLTIAIDENNNKIILSIYTLGKVCLYKKNLRNTKKQSSIKNGKRIVNKNKFVTEAIKSGKLNINELNLIIHLCTGDAVLTAYTVGIVSGIIGIIVRISDFRINYKKFYYEVQPIYSNEEELKLELKCIISKNLAHIIFIMYKSIKECKRGRNDDKDGGKSSNRRAYGNCNE